MLNLRHRLHISEIIRNMLIGFAVLVFILDPLYKNFFVGSYDTNYFIEEDAFLFYLLVVFPLSLVVYVIYNFLLNKKLKNRKTKLQITAYAKNMVASKIPLSPTIYHISESKSEIIQTNNYVAADWGYCDFQFSLFRESKFGRHKAKTLYYSIGMFKLPRKLPNVFFDSKRTGSREFKLVFRKSQKHKLESVFNNFFTTYFHESYSIDSLSFITPEVMQSIMLAKEYDIEIYGDYLYLYNEVEDMPYQLNDIEEKGNEIRQKLLNNILTYRDERLNYAEGRKTVSLLGASLLRSKTNHYVFLFIGCIFSLTGLVSALYYSVFNNIIIWLLIFGIISICRGVVGLNIIRREDKYNKMMSNTGL